MGQRHGAPLTNFGADERELDVLLLIDTSSSTRQIGAAIQLSAAQALGKLRFRDRAGIVVFASDSAIASELTWDRKQVLEAIQALPEPEGGTEFNRNILLTAMYLRQSARPEARRAIVIFTDNLGRRVLPNSRVRKELWEADAILSGLLFRGRDQAGPADVRPFVKATGGDLLKYDGSTDQLALIFARLRSRYTLLYAKPPTRKAEVRRIKVSLTEEAARRLGGRVEIRARTGYVADRPGSDGREKLNKRVWLRPKTC